MFPIREAIRLPVLITHNVSYKYSKHGSIIIDKDILRFGILSFGFSDRQYSYERNSFLKIRGKLIIHGNGFHCFANGTTFEIGDNALCELGDNFSASHNNRIRIMKSLKIGNNNMWSHDNIVFDTDAHHIYDGNGVFCNPNKEVVFGDNVWMGCKNLVLKGAVIPNNTIIASNSVINKEYTEEKCIISSYGKILKRGYTWSRDLL